MILVTGSVLCRAETLQQARHLSLEHVHRSRVEPGCLSHEVHADCDNPLRLCFVERWADAAALQAHFAVPASRAFVHALRQLAAEAPEMTVYQADPLRL